MLECRRASRRRTAGSWVADRVADPRDHRELADQRAVRIRSIRSGMAIGPSTRDPSESSPPGQHRDGGEQGGSGVENTGSRG